MWKRLKPYTVFYWQIFKESNWGELMIAVRTKVGLVIWLIAFFAVAGPGYLYFKYVWPLLPYYIWIIIYLALTTCTLLYLLGATKRYHDRSVRRIRDLGKVRGRGTELFRRLKHQEPLSRDDLDHWRRSVCDALYSAFTMSKAVDIQQNIPRTPDAWGDQISWVNDTLTMLDDLLKQDCEFTGKDGLIDD